MTVAPLSKDLSSPDLPSAVLRLFDGYDPRLLALPEAREFVIGRVLEEGDSHDLAWLHGVVERKDLLDWLEHRGERQLSRRSYFYWQCAWNQEPEEPARPTAAAPQDARLREALWPL